MTIEVKVPPFPESISDGAVAGWHKQPGEQVRRDEALVDIETDKVVLEVPAPDDGVLDKILLESGATVVADQVLGLLRPGQSAAQEPPPGVARPRTDNDTLPASDRLPGTGGAQAGCRQPARCQPHQRQRPGRAHHQGRCPRFPRPAAGRTQARRARGTRGA